MTSNQHTARDRVAQIAEEYGRTDLGRTDHDIILWEHTPFPQGKWRDVEAAIHAFFKAHADAP